MMLSDLKAYKTLVFDCDGVILNSNRTKSWAFYKAALPYGEPVANALMEYHILNGGISRYEKFRHFLDVMVPDKAGPNLSELLSSYASIVYDALLTCEIADGLDELRQATPDAKWLIVSGGDQSELRAIFEARGLSKYFDGGIFGSPDTKGKIIRREERISNIKTPAIFLGDSKYDFRTAREAEFDFIFVANWTEVINWDKWVLDEGLQYIGAVSELAPLFSDMDV
jgi:phosphoglycolate phosphatase-like HAD superfamily hydrolase